ncbi:MAG: type-IV secretion system protein TraC [Rickettsiales bacterium]|nr:type-IV secretion system protein TraC [Rickettsiales bacterium]|tara:strand:+ start:10338 stop:12824 length:2487 start_codon:yes stop_codon:yes gene_type:complete
MSDKYHTIDLGRLNDLLPYESYDPETQLFFNKKSIGFVLEANPLVGASFEDQGQIARLFKEEKLFPEGTSLQIMLLASPEIDDLLENWASYRSGFYKDLASRRLEHLKNTPQTLRNYQVLIAYTRPLIHATQPELEDIIRARDNVLDSFKDIGMQSTILNAEGLLQKLYPLLMLSGDAQTHSRTYNPHEEIARQVVDPDYSLKVDYEHLQVDQRRAQVLIAKQTPDEWALPLMDQMIGDVLDRRGSIPTEFFITYGFYISPKQGTQKRGVFAKREAHEKTMQNNLLKWLPNLKQEYQELDAACIELQGGERIVETLFTVTLMDDPSELENSVHRFKSISSRLGWSFMVGRYDQLPLFLVSMPMTLVARGEKTLWGREKISGLGIDLCQFNRTRKTISKESQNLLPLLAEWKGDPLSPGLLLAGRRGQLFTWSPFGPVLVDHKGKGSAPNENFNLCIAGVPGAGKSVFMQELMVSVLGVGGKVFVLDYGRSFKKTCLLLGGEYIEFEIKNPLSLNPFSEIPEDEALFELREDALANIYPILQTMAAPKEGTNDLQNALLQKAMRKVWNQKKSKMDITDIANDLLDSDDPTAQQLGQMLYPFTRDGIYGRFFNGPAELSLDKDIVVIETDNLRNAPALLTVLVQMMIVHINQTMVKSDRSRPFLIMIDEAWKLLQGKASGSFIEEAGRISRKYKGSIVLATQQLTDYFKEESPAAQKAFENASHKAILKQTPEAITAFKEHPHLKEYVASDWSMRLLKSVHVSSPHYSEVALYSPGVKGVVGRLMLDPFSALLFSTNATDYKPIDEQIHQGVPILEAIENVLQSRLKKGA